MTSLRVTIDDVSIDATWTDDAPETRAALESALPLEGDATRWGDELYFSIPVDVDEGGGRTAVPDGAIAYWPTGNALCLFWGPTPASQGDEPRAASPVNVVAQLEDTSPLESLEPDSGARVRLERNERSR